MIHAISGPISTTRTRKNKPQSRCLASMLALLLGVLFTSSVHAAPQEGDKAPAFSLQGSDGQTHELTSLLGKGVVIAFFPKAFTGG